MGYHLQYFSEWYVPSIWLIHSPLLYTLKTQLHSNAQFEPCISMSDWHHFGHPKYFYVWFKKLPKPAANISFYTIWLKVTAYEEPSQRYASLLFSSMGFHQMFVKFWWLAHAFLVWGTLTLFSYSIEDSDMTNYISDPENLLNSVQRILLTCFSRGTWVQQYERLSTDDIDDLSTLSLWASLQCLSVRGPGAITPGHPVG